MKIKKGDNIIVVTGKDKGKSGKVIKSIPTKNQVVVEGLNLRKKHQRSKTEGGKGQLIEFATPMHVSNVMVSEAGKPARVGKKLIGEKYVRISRKSGKTI